ncbi:fumarylacetoacetase [Ottowia thiooxydans]|uniref:fumarylacetoacetase n=1 Tax=Ottowia thiooxydans TaxID=219182 RepID=UPI000400273B|nr:fumarylacetoacetase [Ottowia thiooxydans]
MLRLNRTHDATARSWLASANDAATDFPLQNLPHGVFRNVGHENARGGLAIGDSVLDLRALIQSELLYGEALMYAEKAALPALNDFLALGHIAASTLRSAIFDLLRDNAPADLQERVRTCLIPMADIKLLLPVRVGGFTDFFTSEHHATRAGRISRPENPLPQAFLQMPMAYNGRASSIRTSGTPLKRPKGIFVKDGEYVYEPSLCLDYELEVGFFVGQGNALGETLSLDEAEQRISGCCLVNDWSTRDIQRAEIFPLGPFLGKSTLTSISPWIVTAEALLPFRTQAAAPGRYPAHLSSKRNDSSGALDLTLTALMTTKKSRAEKHKPAVLTSTNLLNCHWTLAQMLAHHASNGCAIEPGDLMASGTTSGPEQHSAACLYELCIDPQRQVLRAISLPNGESRMWLEDGDEIILRARAQREGFVSIGFGECVGRVEPCAE